MVKAMLTVDPKKRMSAESALADVWIQNKSDKNLDLGQLKKYNAARKLKKAAKKLMAAQKLTKLMAGPQ